ncbi:MAG: metal-dependent hydrolase [Gammaproteobacteria bacterium]|nr:metal-dependent hydrolase [Gammaproteobacteria bacterium]
MATPVGHGLLGLALSEFARRRGEMPNWHWLVFVVFAACAPDLDFLPGLLVGDANRYHQGVSHSLLAAVLFGAVSGLVAWRLGASGRWWGVFAAWVYLSHLLLDLFTRDGRLPYGIPLFWPISNTTYIAPLTPFGGVRHGVPGDSVVSVLGDVFSLHNLWVLSAEALMLAPFAAVVYLWARRRGSAGAPRN